jgi:hypothetical protein
MTPGGAIVTLPECRWTSWLIRSSGALAQAFGVPRAVRR